MARLLAIDYGEKRCGIAVTDESQIIASGLTTVDTKILISWLKEYIAKEEVELFVIGEPKRLHGEHSENEKRIRLKRMDERFTSKIAFDTMIASGISKKKRKDKALVDQISATIILQDYLYNRKV